MYTMYTPAFSVKVIAGTSLMRYIVTNKTCYDWIIRIQIPNNKYKYVQGKSYSWFICVQLARVQF